jgi:hypothetical protein
MTIDEFLLAIDRKAPPAPIDALVRLESALGDLLPSEYREFLIASNGGYVGGPMVQRSYPDRG